MIVADCNLLAYFTIKSEHSATAEAVCALDAVWTAPMLWASEYRSTLEKYMRHRAMTIESALLSLRSAEEMLGQRIYNVASEKVLELVQKSNCSAYDCEYVVLAQDLGVQLVTSDKQVLKDFPKTAVSLENFVKRK